MRFHAPYMEWAKKRPAATFDLAGSNVLSCSIDDLEGARDALALSGSNDNGYVPLVEAIARRYGVRAETRSRRQMERPARTSKPAPPCSSPETTC